MSWRYCPNTTAIFISIHMRHFVEMSTIVIQMYVTKKLMPANFEIWHRTQLTLWNIDITHIVRFRRNNCSYEQSEKYDAES